MLRQIFIYLAGSCVSNFFLDFIADTGCIGKIIGEWEREEERRRKRREKRERKNEVIERNWRRKISIFIYSVLSITLYNTHLYRVSNDHILSKRIQ